MNLEIWVRKSVTFRQDDFTVVGSMPTLHLKKVVQMFPFSPIPVQRRFPHFHGLAGLRLAVRLAYDAAMKGSIRGTVLLFLVPVVMLLPRNPQLKLVFENVPPEHSAQTIYAQERVVLACDFDVDFFRFQTPRLTTTDGVHLTPFDKVGLDRAVFPAFPPFARRAPGRHDALRSSSSGEIELYVDHQNNAPTSKVAIRAGHILVFYQSEPQYSSLPSAQTVTVLGAWAPLKLKPLGKTPSCSAVGYDQDHLWLEIQVDQVSGWIRSDQAYHTIGLIIPPHR